MADDKDKNTPPQDQGTCIVSANSRVREPGETRNGTLTSAGYEMEIIRARERVLDAQKVAEEAIRKAGGAQAGKVIQTIRYKKGASPEIVYLSLVVEQASAEIRESVAQARLGMAEALEAASAEFSRTIDREIRRSLERVLLEKAEEFKKGREE